MKRLLQIFSFAVAMLTASLASAQTTATFSIVEQDSLETAAPGSVRSPWRYSNDSTDLFRYVGSSWVPLFDTLYSRNDSLFYVKFGTEKFAAVVTASGGASQLSDLTDVNTSTPTSGNVLIADGVDFESRPFVVADISDIIADYGDILVTAPDEWEVDTDAVGTAQIEDDAVTAAKIGTGEVGADELAATAVTPGSYTNTDITVDADGRITAASSGSAGGGTVDSLRAGRNATVSNSPAAYPTVTANLSQGGKLSQAYGIMAHIGDSNTNGRPGYRDAYVKEWFGEGEMFHRWTSYNIGQNGSTLTGWKNSIASPNDSVLLDFSVPGAGQGALEYAPGANVWRVITGDTALNRKPDLIFVSLGTNDLNSPANRASIGTEANLRANLQTLVYFLLDSTDAFIVLRMPQPFVNEDFLGITEWVDDAEVLEANRRLKVVYREWIGRHPRVQVIDTHIIFGDEVTDKATDAQDPITGADMIADALHPNDLGYRRIVEQMTTELSNGRYQFSGGMGNREFPEDLFRYATWVAPMYVKSGTAYSSGSANFELYVSQQQANLGRYFNSNNKDGEPWTRIIDQLNTTLLSPQATYQAFLDISGTIYAYSINNGTTHQLSGPTQSQWVTGPPDYAQISATFSGTGTLPAGPVILYSKTAVPFKGSIGTNVTYNSTTQGLNVGNVTNSGRLTVSVGSQPGFYNRNETSQFSAHYSNAGTGSVFNIDVSGSGNVFDIDLTNAQTAKGLEMDMNRTDSYLYNTDTYGLDVNMKHNLDNDHLYGAYFRAYNGRTTLGTNDNWVYGLYATAGTGITSGTRAYAGYFLAESAYTTPVFIKGHASAVSPALTVQTSSVGTAFQVNGDGAVRLLTVLKDDGNNEGTAGQVLTSQGSTVTDGPVWDDAGNLPVTNPTGGTNDLQNSLNDIENQTNAAYQSGSGSPSGVVTPDFIGQEYLDTVGDIWYKSTGVTNTDWFKLHTVDSRAFMVVTGGSTSFVSATPERLDGDTPGTTTDLSSTSDWTVSGSSCTYTGTVTRDFKITVSISGATATASNMTYYIAEEGTVISASGMDRDHGNADEGMMMLEYIVSAATNDTYEVYCDGSADETFNNVRYMVSIEPW